jgi:hypothetical protein
MTIRTQSCGGFFKNGNEHYVPTQGGGLYHDRNNNSTGSVSIQQRVCICKVTITNFIFLLLTNWLGRHARVADHLAVKNAAQGAPLGGGPTLNRV